MGNGGFMPDRNVSLMSTTRSDLSVRDDAALAAALMARERDAAAAAWTRFSPLVLGVLRRFFGPAQVGQGGVDRQDLCQEVFLRFFARIDELREPGALRGFIVGICLGVAQNELRRVRVRRWIRLTPAGELPDVAVTGIDPEARDAMARFYQILARVSVEDRTLFVTRYVEKMEIAELAGVVNLPLSTAKRRLARATRRISAKMSRDPALARYVDGLLSGQAVKS
jgi:RNA polymerase sigma-70 factor (ECF subfamily)